MNEKNVNIFGDMPTAEDVRDDNFHTSPLFLNRTLMIDEYEVTKPTYYMICK